MLTRRTVKYVRASSFVSVAPVIVAVLIGAVPTAHAQVPAPADGSWLSTVNDFRTGLRLRPVTEDAAMSSAARKH